jgi:capsular exopolysaccharide synthesis family protein
VQEEDALATLQDPKSNLSEAYLTIRSNLSFSTDHGVPRSLMVTSTREAEGKSTTSVALAMMAGRTGRRTLLIDADMRSPSLHGYLGLHNPVGLSNFLAGDDNWRHLVQETDAKGLFLMPAGPKPPSPAELLSSDRMGFLVTSLLEQFDHILIDAPPLLGLADAPLLSRAVEGVVFVVEAEGVAVRGLNAALDRLRALNTHIYGAVLTKVHSREAGYGYGYGFGYGYGEEKAA